MSVIHSWMDGPSVPWSVRPSGRSLPHPGAEDLGDEYGSIYVQQDIGVAGGGDVTGRVAS